MCLPNFLAGPGGLGRDDREVSLGQTHCWHFERGVGHWFFEPGH